MNAAVILAAGASSRLGHPKQLVDVDGLPLVARTVGVAAEAGLRPYVVVGSGAAEVVAVVEGAELVPNESWSDGIGTSVLAGAARARHDGASTITVLPCDLPELTPADLEGLLAAADGVDAAAANHGGLPGVPVCFNRTMFDALQRIEPSSGARTLLRSGEWRIALVPMKSAANDIDTPEDLERLA